MAGNGPLEPVNRTIDGRMESLAQNLVFEIASFPQLNYVCIPIEVSVGCRKVGNHIAWQMTYAQALLVILKPA